MRKLMPEKDRWNADLVDPYNPQIISLTDSEVVEFLSPYRAFMVLRMRLRMELPDGWRGRGTTLGPGKAPFQPPAMIWEPTQEELVTLRQLLNAYREGLTPSIPEWVILDGSGVWFMKADREKIPPHVLAELEQ